MAKQLTAADAKQSLTAHVEARGIEVYLKYGPRIGWAELHRLLADRAYVRYPCEIVFDAGELLSGECAHAAARGSRPEEGFTMSVHPRFAEALDRAVQLVLYQLVAVNYGEFASAHDAETFGAAALGITRDEYYAALCLMADELAAVPGDSPVASGSEGNDGARTAAPAEAESDGHDCTCGGRARNIGGLRHCGAAQALEAP